MNFISSLAKDVRAFKADMDKAARTANQRIAKKTERLAKSMSSGTYPQAVFDRPLTVGVSKTSLGVMLYRHGYTTGLAHPYGHGSTGSLGPRGPIPYGNPAIINKQTGLFLRSWHVYASATVSGTPSLILQNTAPYASDLEKGTPDTIRRPLDEVLQRYVQAIGPGIFQEEFDKAWQIRFDTK